MRNLIPVMTVVAALLPSWAGYAVPRPAADATRPAQICDAGSRDVVALPIDQYRRALKLDDAQRAALDGLATAITKAAQDIKLACPSELAPSAPARLATMQARIEAMNAAVAAVRQPLEKFYGALDDEQKEQVVAITQRQGRTGGLLDQDCAAAQAGVVEWPTAEVEQAVHPSDAQRASLVVLQAAVAKAGDIAKGECATETLLTPPARLAATGKRLDTLARSVKAVSGPLDDFYATLDDDQKARFDAISLSPTSQADQSSKPKPAASGHRYHFVNFGYLIRRFLRSF
jgi:LTXXQ motif family protein